MVLQKNVRHFLFGNARPGAGADVPTVVGAPRGRATDLRLAHATDQAPSGPGCDVGNSPGVCRVVAVGAATCRAVRRCHRPTPDRAAPTVAMRVVTEESLVALTKSPLRDLETVVLDQNRVETLTDAFKSCPNLVTLSLRKNRLTSGLGALSVCSELWHLDLSGNSLTSLEGLQNLVALGTLNLAENLLAPDELHWLQDVEVMHLSLKVGRAPCGQPLPQPSTTPNDTAQHTTTPHHRQANPPTDRRTDRPTHRPTHRPTDALTDALTDAPTPPPKPGHQGNPAVERECAPYRPSILRRLPNVWILDGWLADAGERALAAGLEWTPPDAAGGRGFKWGAGEWSAEAPSYIGELAMRFLSVLKEQPTRADLIDDFRLRHICGAYDEDALRHNTAAARQIYGQRPLRLPRVHLKVLKRLDVRVRVDLLVILAAALKFEVPEQVVSEALTVLLAAELGTDVAEEVTRLPPFDKAAVCFELRGQFTGDVQEGKLRFGQDLAELVEAVPAIVARSPREATAADGTGAGDPFARHATILLTRSPSCPPLTATQRTPAAQRIYDAMLPLLQAAGFSLKDLTLEQGDGGVNVKAPRRPYQRPWSRGAGARADDAPQDDFDMLYEYGDGGGGNGGGYLSDSQGGAEEANLSGARCPRPGEHLLWQQGRWAFVMTTSHDGAIITVTAPDLPPAGFHVQRSDVFWDPRGWWIHREAAMQGSARQAQTSRLQRLHRTNGGLTRSGLPCGAGSLNLPMEASGVPHKSVVNVFSADQSWDPAFVMAPPAMIEQQNQLALYAGDMSGGGSAWSRIETAPFVVGGDIPQAPSEAADALAPQRSAVLHVMRTSLAESDVTRGQLATTTMTAGFKDEFPAAQQEHDPATQWETLQRQMGTFREANQGAAALPPLDMDRVRGEVQERRRQREEEQGGGGGGPNVFELTSVLEPERPEQQDLALVPPGLLAGGTVSGKLLARLESELQQEQGSRVLVSKAGMRSWRAIGGKNLFVVADPNPPPMLETAARSLEDSSQIRAKSVRPKSSQASKEGSTIRVPPASAAARRTAVSSDGTALHSSFIPAVQQRPELRARWRGGARAKRSAASPFVLIGSSGSKPATAASQEVTACGDGDVQLALPAPTPMQAQPLPVEPPPSVAGPTTSASTTESRLDNKLRLRSARARGVARIR